MFFLAVTAALFLILLVGLTVLRVLDDRPCPNAELLCSVHEEHKKGRSKVSRSAPAGKDVFLSV